MTSKTPKILVVDDEPDLELLINHKFRKEIKNGKYNFQFAGNGVEALKKLSEDKEIELILTDINMPEMDGLKLLNKIKELNNPLLHSVIVSAYGDLLNIRTAMNGGAFDFVVKPIDLNDLEITIQKAFDNLQTLKEALKSRDELIVVRRELEEARTLQLSMLPKTIPQNKNFDIAVYMKTASEVGGDFYDFSQRSDGSLNVVIGDATGHGMKAGIMVSIMKTLFISDSDEMQLEDFFDVSNKTIKALNLGRLMMAFAMLNINENKIKFINAAMPAIFLYKKSDNKVLEYLNQSMPLGALADFKFNVKEFEVAAGDVILLLSDGLPELQNEDNEQFGYSRLKEVFVSAAEKNPEELISYLKEEGSCWVNDKEPDDDVTFVVIKFK